MTEQERISRIEESLLGLEKQIRALRMELNDLKETQPTATDISVTGIPTVTDTLDTPAPMVIPVAAATSAKIPTPEKTITPAPAKTSAPVSTPAPARATVPSSASVSAQASAKAKPSSKFEENLGGKVMGIVAAVLVFVGLFLFGSMLYERLGDTARIAILFVVSFLLLGAGLFLERKRTSWFTTSLVGCGFGAVYISLFITALYFKRIDKEVLYILLLFWLVGIGLYVFYKHSYPVALLGQIGIAVSVLFGCLGIESAGQFTFLCIYFVLLSLLYLWIVLWRFLPDTEQKPYSWIHLTAAGLNLLQLWALAACYDSLFGKWGTFGVKNPTAGILLCLYCLVLPLSLLLRQRIMANLSLLPHTFETHPINEKTFPVYKAGLGSILFCTIHQLITWIVFSLISGTLFEADVPRGLLLFFGLFASYLITELFGPTGTESRGSTIVTATAVCFTLMWYDFPLLLSVLIPMVFCTATTLFGMFGFECPLRSVLNTNTHRWEYLCKQEDGRCFDKFTACAYLPLILFAYEYGDAPLILLLITIFALAFFAVAFLFLFRDGRKHRFGDAWKIVLYLCGILSAFWVSGNFFAQFDLTDFELMTIVLTLLIAGNAAAFYSGFRKKLTAPDTTDPVANLFVRLVHTGLWIWGIVMLHSNTIDNHPLLCVWLLILTLYLCGSGLYEQYKAYCKKAGLGIYFGLRITLYLLAVMTAFDGIKGYVISCVLLVLAILFVLAGFPLRLAPLRIYGLCLAMFAVVKLLMIDVEHDNSMETVLCFLGAGLLCFAINFIYNHVKKRFNNDVS